MTLPAFALADCLQPDWPAPPGVRALCTTRAGGLSGLPYDSLNLGSHVGDDAGAVASNRAAVQAVIGSRPVFLNQVHGTQIVVLDDCTPAELTADGAFTQTRGIACTVMAADCLPILLCDRGGTQVAAVHAGWRGLAGVNGNGVLEKIFEHFRPQAHVEYALPATELIAWMGPCIGPEVFQVGADVVTAFVGDNPQARSCFQSQSNGKWLANLPALARQRLEALGITQVFGNDASPPWCTVGNPSRFFSHRRDRVSGRHAACIWLE
jgi:YfiH family protein